ncbi:hypothetical protein QBC39DRAFT_348753 [Podospora conica]|nr:hypothetical protein QBC39DRAFT_348753 [Schizothecium conicum]
MVLFSSRRAISFHLVRPRLERARRLPARAYEVLPCRGQTAVPVPSICDGAALTDLRALPVRGQDHVWWPFVSTTGWREKKRHTSRPPPSSLGRKMSIRPVLVRVSRAASSRQAVVLPRDPGEGNDRNHTQQCSLGRVQHDPLSAGCGDLPGEQTVRRTEYERRTTIGESMRKVGDGVCGGRRLWLSIDLSVPVDEEPCRATENSGRALLWTAEMLLCMFLVEPGFSGCFIEKLAVILSDLMYLGSERG